MHSAQDVVGEAQPDSNLHLAGDVLALGAVAGAVVLQSQLLTHLALLNGGRDLPVGLHAGKALPAPLLCSTL